MGYRLTKTFTKQGRREAKRYKYTLPRNGNVHNTSDGRRNPHGECVSRPDLVAQYNAS